jgi:ABC-2 type transport system ATP-binding protein
LLEIRNLILKIGREKTVMLSTHIMQEVEAICERSIIIHKGKIVADDSTKNLQEVSASKTIIRVEFSSVVERALLKQIPGVIDVTAQLAVGSGQFASSIQHPALRQAQGTASSIQDLSAIWHISSKSTDDVRGDIFRFAVDNKLTVLSMQKEELKLEEVFQELTKN